MVDQWGMTLYDYYAPPSEVLSPGTMITLDQNSVIDILKCPVCLGSLDRTKAIPRCGHRFCQNCIVPYISVIGNDKCPCCRERCENKRVLRSDENLDALVKTLTAGLGDENLEDGMADVLRGQVERKEAMVRHSKKRKASIESQLAAPPGMPARQAKVARTSSTTGAKYTENDSTSLSGSAGDFGAVQYVCFTFVACPVDRDVCPLLFDTLIKPYIRAPAQATVADMKVFIEKKFAAVKDSYTIKVKPRDLPDITARNMLIYIHHESKLRILFNSTSLETVARKFWDTKGELVIYYGTQESVSQLCQQLPNEGDSPALVSGGMGMAQSSDT